MPHDQQPQDQISSDVIDYPARDMTITVGTGISVGQLAKILKQENQQLPIDVASGEMTIRELVDSDISGPRQFGYGTLRDYVIGIEASDGSGRVFHAGGRVVKNVAGYDLCRLLIGARGQLGTLRHVTFKLKPLPAAHCLTIAAFRSLKDLASALDRLNLTSTTPQILDVVNRSAGGSVLQGVDPALDLTMLPEAAALLVLEFDGSQTACEWQTKTVAAELHGTASTVIACTRDEAVTLYCEAAMTFSHSQPSTQEAWLAKIVTLPSRVDAVLRVAEEFSLKACGRAGNGIIFLRPGPSVIDGATIRSRLSEIVHDCSGFVEFQTPGETWRYPAAAPTVERYAESLKKLLG